MLYSNVVCGYCVAYLPVDGSAGVTVQLVNPTAITKHAIIILGCLFIVIVLRSLKWILHLSISGFHMCRIVLRMPLFIITICRLQRFLRESVNACFRICWNSRGIKGLILVIIRLFFWLKTFCRLFRGFRGFVTFSIREIGRASCRERV